jgi:dTDP-4-dehydrorhamnose 3,5-epimerase
MPFEFERTAIPEVILVKLKALPDARGFFREMYKQSEFAIGGIPNAFVQVNHSRSSRGVLRGLHYQKNPHPQGKLITVARGSIFDVAVDIRQGSSTYGRWVGETLSEENGQMLYVPPGFAHGFCVLSDIADVLYQTTGEYTGQAERGILWADPTIGIQWPIADPLLSPRDLAQPLLASADNNFVFGES